MAPPSRVQPSGASVCATTCMQSVRPTAPVAPAAAVCCLLRSVHCELCNECLISRNPKSQLNLPALHVQLGQFFGRIATRIRQRCDEPTLAPTQLHLNQTALPMAWQLRINLSGRRRHWHADQTVMLIVLDDHFVAQVVFGSHQPVPKALPPNVDARQRQRWVR